MELDPVYQTQTANCKNCGVEMQDHLAEYCKTWECKEKENLFERKNDFIAIDLNNGKVVKDPYNLTMTFEDAEEALHYCGINHLNDHWIVKLIDNSDNE